MATIERDSPLTLNWQCDPSLIDHNRLAFLWPLIKGTCPAHAFYPAVDRANDQYVAAAVA